jgi:ubiquinone/menaquinone biosynthesis C-methylase UbiE
MSDKAGFFEGTEMPTAGWWEALWPDPAGVLASVGLKPDMEVIDLCSGDGWFTLQIAKVARHVAAIDIDPTLLEVAQVRLKESGLSNCSFIAGEAYGLARLWPQPVDLVFMANAFHGVPDPARLAMAVKAVLKPGGRFAIVNWHALRCCCCRACRPTWRWPADRSRTGPIAVLPHSTAAAMPVNFLSA